jgi:hypothetical protein
MERDPFAETRRIPVLAMPAQNDDFTLFGGSAGHSRWERARLIGVTSSLFDPSGPVTRAEILPSINDGTLSVEPKKFLQLLANFARQTRPHSATVRQLQRTEIPFGTAWNVAPRGRQIVIVADRVFSRAVRVQNGFFGLSNRHKSSVEMIYNKENKEKKEKLQNGFIGLEKNSFEKGSRQNVPISSTVGFRFELLMQGSLAVLTSLLYDTLTHIRIRISSNSNLFSQFFLLFRGHSFTRRP